MRLRRLERETPDGQRAFHHVWPVEGTRFDKHVAERPALVVQVLVHVAPELDRDLGRRVQEYEFYSPDAVLLPVRVYIFRLQARSGRARHCGIVVRD